ncbi:MAG: hypothetical protein ACT4NL_15775, partial [Pseudomarimonas sp.]
AAFRPRLVFKKKKVVRAPVRHDAPYVGVADRREPIGCVLPHRALPKYVVRLDAPCPTQVRGAS